MLFGYTGAAASIPESVLIAGSIYAAGVGKFFFDKQEQKNELNDHKYIDIGVKMWKKNKKTHYLKKLLDDYKKKNPISPQ